MYRHVVRPRSENRRVYTFIHSEWNPPGGGGCETTAGVCRGRDLPRLQPGDARREGVRRGRGGGAPSRRDVRRERSRRVDGSGLVHSGQPRSHGRAVRVGPCLADHGEHPHPGQQELQRSLPGLRPVPAREVPGKAGRCAGVRAPPDPPHPPQPGDDRDRRRTRGIGTLGHSPIRMRRQSSTWPRVDGDTRPQASSRRSFEIERTASQSTAEGRERPPSGGLTTTCEGMPRIVFVIGATMTSSAGPRLNSSTERTSTGRRPACSRPWTGLRSASQTSPRCGSMGTSAFIAEAVADGTLP